MSVELTKQDMIEAMALGWQRALASPAYVAAVSEAAVKSLMLSFEILPPRVLAWLLERSETTLNRNHVDWGFDKSVAMGREGSLYLMSQVIEALKARVVEGRRPEKSGEKNVTPFPEQTTNQKAS